MFSNPAKRVGKMYVYMRTRDHDCVRYPWTVEVQIDLETDLFYNFSTTDCLIPSQNSAIGVSSKLN